MKKLATILALIMVLAMVVPITAQEPGQQFEATPLSPDEVLAGDAAKAPPLPAAARPSADVAAGELELVSIIVTFDESFDPATLEAATGGQVIHRYRKVFNGASIVLAGEAVDGVEAKDCSSINRYYV